MASKTKILLPLIGSLFLLTTAVAEPLKLDVRQVEAGYDERAARPILKFTLTDTGAQAWRYFTSQNIGRRVELRIDGKGVLVTVIREPILGAKWQVTVSTADEARELAEHLSKVGVQVEAEVLPQSN
jgi:preprotein translocase subunit SecD